MTLVSQIITDAHRQSNILAIATDPTPAQQAEGLRFLQRIVASVYGHEAGEGLDPFPVGRHDIVSPVWYPGYNDIPPGDWFLPKNKQMVCNLTNAVSIPLHPRLS